MIIIAFPVDYINLVSAEQSIHLSLTWADYVPQAFQTSGTHLVDMINYWQSLSMFRNWTMLPSLPSIISPAIDAVNTSIWEICSMVTVFDNLPIFISQMLKLEMANATDVDLKLPDNLSEL